MSLKVTSWTAAAVVPLWSQAPAAADRPPLAQTSGTEKTPAATEKAPGRASGRAVQVKGTLAAVDKDNRTVTLKGPKGRTVTLEVQDPQKLDAIKVGDPVVATYMEALAFQIKKSGTATPGTTVQETRVSSKPGETPAGAIGQEVTVTTTITAIDKKAGTVTIKGPQGNTETVKAKDPKNLDLVKVGDLVEITYARALWNGNDPILKERLFGLTNSEGNHGEDVKEYYFYLDSTPTHSYMKYLYKYPQAAFPYADLVAGNKSRARLEPEYELLDTGVFDDDRYFDGFVEGGFLGLDNIGVFDRSGPLPSGGRLEQADGTAWMAFYCQTMLQLALELALHDPVYQKLAAQFYEHFLWIAGAMDHGGGQVDLWDEDDGFFYDLLRLPTGSAVRLKVRSMVGLLSLCASTVFPPIVESRLPVLMARVRDFTRCHPHLVARIASPGRLGYREGRLLGLLPDDKLRRVLRYMLDESEFLSPFGIRAVSKIHRDHPYAFAIEGQTYRVDYEPAEDRKSVV